MPERRFPARFQILAYACGTLLLLSLTLWHYLMGHYARILPAAILATLVAGAALLTQRRYLQRGSAYIVLLSGYLAIAVEAPYLGTSISLWMGVPPILTTLLLPPGAALLLNMLLAPMWLLLISIALPAPVSGTHYVTLVVISILPLGWYMQQSRLLKSTDHLDTRNGIISRDTLSERLVAEVERARALNQSLSALVIHLPQVDMADEQFGQTTRDMLLMTFCRIVQRGSRRGDALGQHQHNVFWLLLANAGEAGALIVRERLMQALGETRLAEIGAIQAQIRICQLADDESAERFEQRLISRGLNLLEPDT